MARYARKLTKQELIDGGIFITPENRIFKNGVDITDNMSLNPSGYRIFSIYDRDSEGKCIKKYYTNKKGRKTYNYVQRTITLNRALLAWHTGCVEEGYVSDHINNVRSDYSIGNLQQATPSENLAKERTNWNIKKMKCNMHKPKEFYLEKLSEYLKEYEIAKLISDAEAAKRLRGNISNTRARLRYWDEHKAEYEAHMAQSLTEGIDRAAKRQSMSDRKLLKQFRDEARESGDTTKWHYLNSVIRNWDKYDATVKHNILSVLLGKIEEII